MTPWWTTLISVLAGGGLTMAGSVWIGWRNRKAAGREEWFRRLQWAQQMIAAQDERTKVAGYNVLRYLSTSPLANDEDLGLLEQLGRDPNLSPLAAADSETVDDTDYILDDGDSTEQEAQP